MNIKTTKEGWNIIEGDTHVGKWVEETGRLDHDRFLIPLIESMLKPGMVVIDAGALYGDHSIAYARAVGETGAVFAIEANPMAFECLSKNAEKFQAPMFLMNLALGEEHGGDCIHIMAENVGASSVTKNWKTPKSIPKNHLEAVVKTASIDGLIEAANLEALHFIKIDCEGWEFKILKGAKGAIRKFKPILVIEMNSWALSQQDASYKDIYDLLIDLNYDWRIIQPEAKGGDLIYDIMAWPKQIETLRIVAP
jgi:FkbM family methyltransferase